MWRYSVLEGFVNIYEGRVGYSFPISCCSQDAIGWEYDSKTNSPSLGTVSTQVVKIFKMRSHYGRTCLTSVRDLHSRKSPEP